MECDNCKQEWDNKKHVPRILSCGHSICEECLSKIIGESKDKGVNCPTCNVAQMDLKSVDDINKLKKNAFIIRIYDKVESNKKNLMSMSFTTQSLDKTDENFFKKEEIKCYYHLCSAHKNIASFTGINRNRNRYYCEQCIDELDIKHYFPLTNLYQTNDTKIVACLNKSKIIKKEIARVEDFLKKYLKTFEIQNTAQIEELFNYFKKILEYNYTTTKTLFSQCKKEQKSQIDKSLDELNLLKNELETFETEVQALYNENTNTKSLELDHQKKLNEIFLKLSNYLNYENKLNLFQMKLNIQNDAKDNMFEIIQNSYDIDIDLVKMKDGSLPTIRDLLNKNAKWQCQCGNFENSVDSVECSSCQRYRKLESFENLIFNPLKASNKEISLLNRRRRAEAKQFKKLMKKDHESNATYALDTGWFLQWRCYITNDLSDTYYMNTIKKISENRLIGVLPPRYISNGNIAEKVNDEYKLKPKLNKMQHYLSINSFVWEWFHKNYEGGPEILLAIDDALTENDSPSQSPLNEYCTSDNKIEFDPNNTILNDTINKIAPISNYNFNTKLSDFKLTNSPEKSEYSFFEKRHRSDSYESLFKNQLDSINIPDTFDI